MKPSDPLAASASSILAWRVLTLVNVFRLLVPPLLAILFVTLSPSPVGQVRPGIFIGTALAYFLFAIGSIPGIRRRTPGIDIQSVIGGGVDVIAIALLTYSSGGMSSGLGAILVLPIGAASFILGQRLAFMLAALAALSLLVQQGFMTLMGGPADAGDFTAAGIVGALIFILTLGIGPLSRSLRESEERVRLREVDAANLAELNQFIVQHLRESILVVDENDSIRLINESASQLLKRGPVSRGTPLGEVSPRLLYLLGTWRAHSYDWQMSSLSVVTADGGSIVQPHFVSLDRESKGPTLIFLEDMTLIAERVQQSKLAALGRLSASIAHEIRNPVGAMSHAAQLLAEAPSLSAQEKRLTTIITNNGERVSTIIDNVLQLSRRDTTRQERIELNGWMREFLTEFRQTSQIGEDALRFDPAVQDLEVRVDPTHLHQLMWNLCENALKYGRDSQGQGIVEIQTGRIALSERPYLEVLDRGPGISAPDAERIFEPFFTGGKGGTGLGLFIARELAQCNRAVLAYEARPGGGASFRLVFADPQRWE
ncbi:MAG TPA: HAMP domain-containing sensor histidine kinase [Povalibacter sp.]|uniref:sensor histidine kinase n=1 Tax=Povalibacter sp. TaxID=1962978 RepID=UPI002BE9F737|nr:HAMP domain-containing sensor histidine kinase [Povalibacter sp.]HMN46794.1 HAMP domain-containing sensor histidine kinase [Povalibacter sp.]